MLLDKNVKIKVGSRTINHIKNNGYVVKCGDIIEFPIKKLPKGSHINVRCECENCGRERTMWYKDYIGCTLDGEEKYVCQKCNYVKIKNTNLLKYGVENVMMINENVEKMKKTNLLIYKCECSLYNSEINSKLNKLEIEEKRKNTRINKNHQIPDCDLTKFEKYKKLVNHYTHKNKNKLFEKWDGYDYYDNTFILNNFVHNSNDTKYPTIDHKLSIFYGFKFDISPMIIGDLFNLCITKRGINSIKNKKNDYEFKIK
jgi:hypothetical protein